MNATSVATSELYWLSAALLTVVDLSALYCLSQCVPASRFRKAGSEIAVVSLLFWGGLWGALMVNDTVWEWCYCYIFSEVDRWRMPLLMAVLFSLVGVGMWWLSTRLPINPVLTFAALGALVSLPDHFYAIFVKKVLETPMLAQVSTASAVVFGIFEFVFYWILIMSIAIFARSVHEWWSEGRHNFLKHMLQP